MNKRRGHYCRICGGVMPNGDFTGKGHRIHVCKKCARMPKEERQAIEQRDEIFNFLRQANISKKNMVRLRGLVESEHEETAALARIVLDVAGVKPHKTRRLTFLARQRPDLLKKLKETGLVMAHGW